MMLHELHTDAPHHGEPVGELAVHIQVQGFPGMYGNGQGYTSGCRRRQAKEQARTWAAAMIISSRMRVERLMDTPRPMPGKTYAVRQTPGRRRCPLLSSTVSVLDRACQGIP